jgi:Phage terminase large subunit (GpA)
VIAQSPELSRLVNVDVNNLQLKQIGNNFLYLRGTNSETAAISVSADCVVADEIDRCDPDTLKQFRSRMQASEHRIVRQFSTPTIDGIGISREAQTSRRFKHFCKCVHCNHKFLPDYYNDIVIPKFTKSLDEVSASNLKDIAWQKARWNCPNCGRDPNICYERLEWVLENPDDNYISATYYVSAATAYGILQPAYLVQVSTTYNTKAEFVNQALGQTCEQENEQMTLQDLENCTTKDDLSSSDLHVLGVDMGTIVHFTVGRVTSTGTLLIVHRERCVLNSFEERLAALKKQYRVQTTVLDSMPYTDLVMRQTERDPRSFGSIFVTTKNLEMYTVQQKREDERAGGLNLRQLKVNRLIAFDHLRNLFKTQQILIKQDDFDWNSQYLSLKRVQKFDKDGGNFFSWEKTDGNDHGFFALLYCMLASKLVQVRTFQSFEINMPLVTSFRLKDSYA